jgi:hypothetical protein
MLCRFSRPLVCALAALAFSIAAVPAAAQEAPPTEFESWRVPGWTFTPGVVVGTLYDTNVTLSGPDVNGKTPTDKLFQLQPFGQLAYLSPRTAFSSGYQGSMRRYFDLGSLDGTDHHGYLSLRHLASRRVTIFVNDNYSRVPTTDQLDIAGVPFQRTGARYNSLNGGIEDRLTRTTDAMVRYEMTWVDFVRKDTLLTGGIVHGIEGEVTHRFTGRVSAGGQYSLRRADLNEGTREQSYQDAGGVFRYRSGPETTFEASAGIAHLLDRNSGLTHSGPYGKLGLIHHTQRSDFGLAYSRSYVPSLSFGGTNQSQELRGYIRMPLDRNRLYLQEAASWRRTNPFVTTELPLDSIFLHTVFGYAVQKWFRIEGYHSFTTQDNRIAGGQIDRHVVGVQFVVSEPVRIR